VSSGENEFRLSEPIKASGEIGLAITGYDMADGVYNKFAFYKTELLVDDKMVFKLVYDTLSYNVTEQIDIEISYPHWIEDKTVYHKLYIDPYNTLPFYDRALGTGLIPVSTDTISFAIIVSDFNNNKKTISGIIIQEEERQQQAVEQQEDTSAVTEFPWNKPEF